MNRRLSIRIALTGALLAALVAQAQTTAPKRKPDLGDAVEGRYAGDVISDSKGSSRDGVQLTLTRAGVNRVRITSDYSRLPVVEVTLTQAMGRIIQARGDTAFVLDRSKTPARLDVSFHNEVSWAGERR